MHSSQAHFHSITSTRRRTATLVRACAVATILFAPIIAAAWQIRHGPAPGAARAVPPNSDEGRAVAQYLATRSPALDSLLPEGTGGTLFVPGLDGKAGVAIAATATILIASEHVEGAESTELHERAHLLHAFLPREVGRLIARLPDATAGQYAATNAREHFAEMAAAAWHIVSPDNNMCLAVTPAEQLRAAEKNVPGTSGFVLWYLRSLARQHSDIGQELMAEAVKLAAPVSEEWAAIWTRVEKRRVADGTLEPWKAPDVAGRLALWRSEEWHSRDGLGKFSAVLLTPSVLIAKII